MKKNGKRFYLRKSDLISVLLMFFIGSFAYAETIDDIRVLKISSQDQRAAVKLSDGKMVIIKTGDVLRVAGDGLRVVSERKKKKRVAGYEVRVKEIAEGRVVFEERKDRQGLPERVVIRVAGSGKQRVERMKRTSAEKPLLKGTRTSANQDSETRKK